MTDADGCFVMIMAIALSGIFAILRLIGIIAWPWLVIVSPIFSVVVVFMLIVLFSLIRLWIGK